MTLPHYRTIMLIIHIKHPNYVELLEYESVVTQGNSINVYLFTTMIPTLNIIPKYLHHCQAQAPNP